MSTASASPRLLVALPLALLAAGCTLDLPAVLMGSTPTPGPPTRYSYRVLRSHPHDPVAFTEGLVYHDGVLFESTGLAGQSTLRVVDLETGVVLRQVALPSDQFGEGIAIYGERLFQLTWTSGFGYTYGLATLEVLGTFPYTGEGWGLTHDGEHLILSDGTATLRWLDVETMEVTGRLTVSDQGQPVAGLNELEWVEGEIYANVWPTDRVARIAPGTGQVLGWVDFAELLPAAARGPEVDVLNGIAYDIELRRLFVTGKRWPLLFEVELVPAAAP